MEVKAERDVCSKMDVIQKKEKKKPFIVDIIYCQLLFVSKINYCKLR